MYSTARLVILILATALAGPVLADADPSLSAVYEASRTGHLDHAQQMMDQVLRDHPKSAKAHYVRAELYAKQGNVTMGRQELKTAMSLDPGLAFATPESMRALQSELSRPQTTSTREAREDAGSSLSLRTLAIVVLVAAFLLWMFFRLRSSPGNVNSQPRDAMTAAAAPPGTVGGTGASPSVGSGMGAGIAGGLAGGLAAGAGIVAGEEIARRFLDPDRNENNPTRTNDPAIDVEHDDPDQPDFGVSGGSWDDDGPASDDGSGNDDWS